MRSKTRPAEPEDVEFAVTVTVVAVIERERERIAPMRVLRMADTERAGDRRLQDRTMRLMRSSSSSPH